MRSTKDIKVIVLTERWAKEWKRDDGSIVAAGWQKPKGWPARGSQRPDGDLNDFSRGASKAYHECTLYQALTHHASTPAYFVGYKPIKIGLRIRKDALHPLFSEFTEDAGGIHMHLALFDVDQHDDLVDFPTWYEEELDKIQQLIDAHPGIIVYRSKRGYRIIAALPTPVHLKDSQDSNTWDRTYTAWCNYLTRRFSINADVLLDWTRFQAVPHTKKEKDEPALDLEVIGDVEQIGIWEPELTESDYPPERKVTFYEGANYEGECQLLALIHRAGLRCDVTDYANVYDICCPNWTTHSPDSRGLQDYPSKTVLYTNGPIGKIECKSSGCRHSHPDRQKDYFKHFDPKDVEQTAPKPPVDVWDENVLHLANVRNSICGMVGDRLGTDDRFASNQRSVTTADTTYKEYLTALSMQTRLKKKTVDVDSAF